MTYDDDTLIVPCSYLHVFASTSYSTSPCMVNVWPVNFSTAATCTDPSSITNRLSNVLRPGLRKAAITSIPPAAWEIPRLLET